MVPLFIYGSLKAGLPNHRRLAGARFVHEASTEPRFTLYDLGPYPAMTCGGTTSVAGELYEVDLVMLEALDRFEGCPTLYARAEILLADGTTAHAYLFPVERIRDVRVITDGRWNGRR
jgi:gamma-glutamylcyclotransferase (GGCT)/AIG2-like uncharacterized protein YtfP